LRASVAVTDVSLDPDVEQLEAEILTAQAGTSATPGRSGVPG
jgi:hypothetical protein